MCATLFISYLAYMSYQMIGYLKGVETDVKQNFILAKKFFMKYSFSGKILNSSICNGEHSLSYFVLIKLDSSIKLPSFPHDSYYREYNFDTKNKTVKIRVSKEVYENAEKNTAVIKPADSDSIYINGKRYLLLGKKEYEWIAN